ncbi:MAG: twitching motility protein PilT [Lachnospiraceae bacterium]|nr:twitching motility protein PilT [Lachnospiraceae bacterium]
MVELIVGKEGKGKTKQLLDKVNNEIKNATGNIVYLDRSTKHMFELNNKVRLINVGEYDFQNVSEFIGFIYGIISQDHDIQQMYIDGMMKVAKLQKSELSAVIKKLDSISENFHFDFIISISADMEELDEEVKKHVVIAL